MKTAFLFVGQGAQKVGMGRDFYENFPEVRAIYDDSGLDFDLRACSFEGPQEKLTDTAYAQSCLLAASYAMALCLKNNGVEAEMTAGLSLGEYTALTYAGVFSVKDALKITRKRGELMAHALPEGTGMMAAVLGAEEALIAEACAEASALGVCGIANYNSPGQIVISGATEAVKKAAALLKARGVRRVLPLKVSGAFHSPLLKEAAGELAALLSGIDMQKPRIPVVSNVDGTAKDRDLRAVLTRQMYSPVYFERGIRTMLAQGVDTFVEVGPGRALSGFVKKIDPAVRILNVEDVKTFEQALTALA